MRRLHEYFFSLLFFFLVSCYRLPDAAVPIQEQFSGRLVYALKTWNDHPDLPTVNQACWTDNIETLHTMRTENMKHCGYCNPPSTPGQCMNECSNPFGCAWACMRRLPVGVWAFNTHHTVFISYCDTQDLEGRCPSIEDVVTHEIMHVLEKCSRYGLSHQPNGRIVTSDDPVWGPGGVFQTVRSAEGLNYGFH